jgi:neutral ceramidase
MHTLNTLSRTWVMFVLILSFTGCASVNMEISRQTPQQSMANTGLLAGAAKADITAPPGMPMGGYALWANYGQGFRTRLYARVLYLKPDSGRSVALVQCDFLTGSLLLNHRVAELIAKETDIGIDGLLIAGTHTHSAPSNYADNNFYNDNTSNARGFDPDYFHYLSTQIADAVINAYQKRMPAKMATGKTQIFNMTRNRSIDSYHANKNISEENPPDIYEAVNPEMHMIRVDALDHDGQYRPLAAVSTFSIHATAVSSKNDFYNGDVFAYIEREVEYGIKGEYKTSWEPIHAAFNSTHADTSPNYSKQGFPEARRLGKYIGGKAWELFRSMDGKLKNDVTIVFAAKEINLYSEPCIDGICLCDRPVVGASLAAGADDGASPILKDLPWTRQGSPRWFFTKSCQGHKRTLGGPFQYLVLPKKDFPHQLFLQAIQIDDILLLPLPFETTKESGTRIARQSLNSLAAENKEDIRSAVVISCANGYFGYMTTPEEYSIQRYEGGHTLYGPQTQPFLAGQLSKLALEMGEGNIENNFPEKWSYNLKSRRFTAGVASSDAKRASKAEPALTTVKKDEEPYWSFAWEDLPPNLISWEQTLVQIEESSDKMTWEKLQINGRPMDDSGYDISILCKDIIRQGKTGIYETRWYNPETAKNKYYRFAILPQPGQDYLYSSPFR